MGTGEKPDITHRQLKFVVEYLVDLNATQAAIRAGYAKKGAHVHASRMLRNPKIMAEIDRRRKVTQERVEVKTEDVLREILRLAMVDIGDAFHEDGTMKPLKEMSVDVRRAISAVEVESIFAGRGGDREQVGALTKIKFWDKKGSLELLGKHLKLFTDKIDLGLDKTLEQLVLESMNGKNGNRAAVPAPPDRR